MRVFCKKTAVMAVLLMSLLMTGCTHIREIVSRYEAVPTEAVKVTSESEYTYLSNEEEILEMLVTTMKNNKSSCSFNVGEKELVNADLWMVKLGGISNISVEWSMVQNGYNVYVTMEYWDNYPIVAAYEKNDTTGLTARQAKLFEKYCQILGECVTADMSSYEKELAIHDYLVENIEYDTTQEAEYTHSAYGALINGTSVCDGYAECFKTLMDMIGIQSIVVTGEGNGENHCWNMVMLDGAWYHVDVTWDDPVGGMELISHKYFNMSDVDMNMEHKWDTGKYPAAVGTKYSYYLLGDIKQIYSQDEFNSYIGQCISDRADSIEAVVHADVSLDEALKAAGLSLSYTYNIIDRGIFKVYEMTITYK